MFWDILVNFVLRLWEIFSLFQGFSVHPAKLDVFFEVIHRFEAHGAVAFWCLLRWQVRDHRAYNWERIEQFASWFCMLSLFKVCFDVLAQQCFNKITATRMRGHVIFDVVNNAFKYDNLIIDLIFKVEVVNGLFIDKLLFVRVRVLRTWSVILISHDS